MLDICGDISIDFLFSLCDLGDVFLEQKETAKAKSFYLLVAEKIKEHFGKDSIFLIRVNSALVELYTAEDAKDNSSTTVTMNNL